jgi:uncharacterized protein
MSSSSPSAPATYPFHVMLKPRGPICNLDCRYCYFLSKEQLYPGSAFRMSGALLEDYTRQYIEAQPVPEVTFAWQGGEPTLMGLAFFERAVELQRQYARPGMRIRNSFQTNGVLLDADWCRFFREHDFLVGISLDGPRDLHNAYRVDKGGQPTFDRVMRGLAQLKAQRVEFNVLACVHAANVGHPLDVYRFLRDEAGAQFIQFIPIVENPVSERSVTGEQYGAFLTDVFDEWVRRDVGRVFVQIFDAALAAWIGQRPGLCIFEETCGAALVMEHNGDVYACDHFVDPAYYRGNLQQLTLVEMAECEAQQRFGQDKRDTLPRLCRECDVRFVCNGGCPKNRLLTTPDGEPGLNWLCDGYRAFFRHIDRPMRLMVAELRAERPPANVMLYLAREEAARARQLTGVGRNDPCPCGSGRKFKHCCGKTR